MTHYCTQCGAPLPDNTNFCPRCGAKAVYDMPQPQMPAAKSVYDAPQPMPVYGAAPAQTGMIPAGIATDGNGNYTWTGECSIFKCSPFAKIVSIVCAVFAVLTCIIIIAVEGGDAVFPDVLIHCLIGVAIVGAVDGLICLVFAVMRGFRYRAVFTIGINIVSGVEQDAVGKSVALMILRIIFILIVGLIMIFSSFGDDIEHGDSYHRFSAEYGRITDIIPSRDKRIIRIKAGINGGRLVTTPEQHDFILGLLMQRTGRR